MNYENLKVLFIKDFYFKLPEDFNGGLDALRLYVDYHDEVKNTDKHEIEDGDKLSDGDVSVWYRFLDAIEKGQKMTGCLSISECKMDEDDGVYKMKAMKDFDTK